MDLYDDPALNRARNKIAGLRALLEIADRRVTELEAQNAALEAELAALKPKCITCATPLAKHEEAWDGDYGPLCEPCFKHFAWPVAHLEEMWQGWKETGLYGGDVFNTWFDGAYLTWNEWCDLAHGGEGCQGEDE